MVRGAGGRRLLRAVVPLAALGLLAAGLAACVPPPPLPDGFQETTIFTGLDIPMDVEFSPDGRVFVAEKSGIIKVFSNLSDTTPGVFADLRTNVHNFWDRGLEGIALDPSFPFLPYVYVLYTHDAAIGGTAPRWGEPGQTSDDCPDPPGATSDGCVVSGRLSRLEASGDVMTGTEKVLVEGWCQQYPSHSLGDIQFGADGALYASAGEGASFEFADWGQDGDPRNPCGDAPVPVGGNQNPPTAQGGSLRAQDLRTTADPTGLNGTIIRVDPATGAGLPSNPFASSSDANKRRIVAFGLRNPFRFDVKPGTNALWIGDVGWNGYDEIDRDPSPGSGGAMNFGWPCYEGPGRQSAFDNANLNVCEDLYQDGSAAPFFSYGHAPLVEGDPCPTGSMSLSGLAFYDGGSYPATYDNALFFADYTRNCIWVILARADGSLDKTTVRPFHQAAASPVDLEVGPDGDLFYVDVTAGTVRRISFADNRSPTAVIDASTTSGPSPLRVDFDGTRSSDPDPGDSLTYEWDLDGDGAYDDGTVPRPSRTYNQSGVFTARLRVTDEKGATGTTSQVIAVDNDAPEVSIHPAPTTWRVGESIGFLGEATDRQDGRIPRSRMSWSLVMRHCSTPGSCHAHFLQTFPGTDFGNFPAPDHEYPSYLELSLTATDRSGLSTTETFRLDPRTVELSFTSHPTGVPISVGASTTPTPFTKRVIVGSTTSVSAPERFTQGTSWWNFASWSDGGARSHAVTAGTSDATYRATYERQQG